MRYYESLEDEYKQRRLGIKLLLESDPFITPYEIAIIENGGDDFARGSLGGKISAIKKTIRLLDREQNVQECDATPERD